MRYKELYVTFPLLNAFGQRDLPKAMAVKIGWRISKLRDIFNVLEGKRVEMAKKYEHDDEGKIAEESDRQEFLNDWQEMLEVEVEDYPEWKSKLTLEDMPDNLSPLESEALYRFGMLEEE